MSIGGDLPSIHDSATNNFLASQFVPQAGVVGYWIGLTCDETLGPENAACTWLDGIPFDFQDFTNGAPDGAVAGAPCAGNICLASI
uniref:C-type lectin domain-containing protein n=1 Tax=Acrobeloides nanus TaxID=290746 RepID=A0A914DYS9_9BILA